MQDGTAIPADEAGAWLRKNQGDGVTVTIVPAKANPAVYREIQEILFGPEDVSQTT